MTERKKTKPSRAEKEARLCKWDSYNEPPIGHPRNKDFMEADVQKIIEALTKRDQRIAELEAELRELRKGE